MCWCPNHYQDIIGNEMNSDPLVLVQVRLCACMTCMFFCNYSQFVSWLVLFLFLLVVVNSLRFVKVLLKFY